MIALSEKQSDIIHKLIVNKEHSLGYYGLSSNGLARAGINRQTFAINKEFLLQNYLISHVATEYHNKQKWRFFDATPLGFLVLYQNHLQGNNRYKKPSYRRLERYFPVIFRNWDILSEIFPKDTDYDAEDFLDAAVGNFSIDNKPKTVFQSGYSTKPITVKMNLNFGFYDISLKSEFQFDTQKFSFKRKHNIEPVMDDRDLFMKNIRENFTFLFFFSMFNQKQSYKNDVLSRRLISIINDDKDLNQIFNNKVKFTFKFVNEKPLISFLSKNIHGKPRLVLKP